jgi:hypothetical protein
MPEDGMNWKQIPDCFIKPPETGFDMAETTERRIFAPMQG